MHMRRSNCVSCCCTGCCCRSYGDIVIFGTYRDRYMTIVDAVPVSAFARAFFFFYTGPLPVSPTWTFATTVLCSSHERDRRPPRAPPLCPVRLSDLAQPRLPSWVVNMSPKRVFTPGQIPVIDVPPSDSRGLAGRVESPCAHAPWLALRGRFHNTRLHMHSIVILCQRNEHGHAPVFSRFWASNTDVHLDDPSRILRDPAHGRQHPSSLKMI